MQLVLLILWVVFNFFLIRVVFDSNSKMWYYRGRRDSYQHMIDDIDEWRKKHPGMDINEHWESALRVNEYRKMFKEHKREDS